MCHKCRRIEGEEELGRRSLGHSWSSTLITGAVTSSGVFSIQTEYTFICTYPTLSWVIQEGSDTPNSVSVSLTEGRQKQMFDPTQLRACLCWLDVLCFSWSIAWTLLSEKNRSWGLQAGSFWFPKSVRGILACPQRDGQASSLRSSVRLVWSGLGST